MAKARIAFGTALLTLLCGRAGAVEPLKLEDYVPADFHRRYLSVEPRLDWNRSGYETELDLDQRESSDASHSSSLRLRHGSERFTQDRRWVLDCGLDMALGNRSHGYRSRPTATSAYTHLEDNRDPFFNYSAISRLDARQYLRGAIFLAPQAGLEWSHSPPLESERAYWTLYNASSPADSSRFYRNRSRYGLDPALRQRQAGRRVRAHSGRAFRRNGSVHFGSPG